MGYTQFSFSQNHLSLTSTHSSRSSRLATKPESSWARNTASTAPAPTARATTIVLVTTGAVPPTPTLTTTPTPTDRTTTPTLMEALTTTVLEVLRILPPTVIRTRLAAAAAVGQASKQ